MFWKISLIFFFSQHYAWKGQLFHDEEQSKAMDWFLYDRDLRHERVKIVPRILVWHLRYGISQIQFSTMDFLKKPYVK